MEFPLMAVCGRTSSWNNGDRPCEEAEMAPYVRVDRRTVDDPMKNPHIGEAWYKAGENHRVEGGQIARDFPEKRWMVELKDAGGLFDFIVKYGEIVAEIDTVSSISPFLNLEIYDDYRE